MRPALSSKLSSELKVACEIFQFNEMDKPVWFGKLVESLEGEVSKNTISESLDTLSDWMVIRGSYGSLENGRAGYLYRIESHDWQKIKELYEKYWKVPR